MRFLFAAAVISPKINAIATVLCALCRSFYEIRLCEDGLYYCNDCRDASDYRTQD